MKRVVNISVLLFFCFLTIQCSKDKNKAPTAVRLMFPTQNLLCIDNTITFNWSKATDPDNDQVTYNLIIATDREMTNVVENSSSTDLKTTVTLEKQTAYYWKVDALDVKNNQGTASETFSFYTKGDGVLNYAPFSAELVSPKNNSNLSTTTSISLIWDAADANTTDTLTYELYFGENSSVVLMDDSLSEKSFTVSVKSGKTYSWYVNVKDQNAAKSIGQTWSFTVN
ncbi:glycoside hydrolase family 78 protein [Polaribacter glomeratus]|uniref:Fibronectin type-III domain-containing protein n=1 Tax=Polaribacter glomeratus TaxID=102 RepID=A0A2S7WYZ7_9FLAO|nr:hypothetical protein [Polaribacter glomeratus]PQJ82746.1 hypothetical protein BTO16_09225 [Polaribacter glomeratus]TXD65291.1 hypothetical protein ESX12_10710 [Polaribacter glomeratus]